MKEAVKFMKKLMIGLLSGLAVISMVACSPTTKETSPAETESVSGMPTGTVESAGGIEDKVPDPDAEPVEIVSIYSPDSNGTRLKKVMGELPELDAQALVDQLIAVGVLEEGTEVLDFTVEGEASTEVGPGVAADEATSGEGKIGTLNLSQVPVLSDAAKEELMLGAVGNTFIENYELDELKLLVNGENYTSANIQQGDDDYLTYLN